ncbi:hypothetical protein [Natronorarus salvus]|uniref:hypothetical protein n=1 Tax=Natronorarus salvus TaxID=3117733 RepID=UPI002F26DA20
MSQGITHFSVGAAATAVLVTLLPPCPYSRTLVLLGGVWALIPDAAKLVPHPLLRRFHRCLWADLFWFHRTLDRLDEEDSARIGALSLSVLLTITALLERRSYRVSRPDRERSRIPSPCRVRLVRTLVGSS